MKGGKKLQFLTSDVKETKRLQRQKPVEKEPTSLDRVGRDGF